MLNPSPGWSRAADPFDDGDMGWPTASGTGLPSLDGLVARFRAKQTSAFRRQGAIGGRPSYFAPAEPSPDSTYPLRPEKKPRMPVLHLRRTTSTFRSLPTSPNFN
jgi:hypothetical protein